MAMTPNDLALIPAQRFVMGAERGLYPGDGEAPMREVQLSAYRIGRGAVSTADFARFVAATGYRTLAEARGASHVFQGQLADPDSHPVASGIAPWWRVVPGACWRRPAAGAEAAAHHPVVHVCLADAQAFCAWAGGRLPTEAEWECAAQPQEGIAPHIWQGEFPDAPLTPPGPKGVADGPANANGLVHACGNVWEWTADRFTHLHSPRPQTDPKGPLNGAEFVVKGGSFLCAPSYCARYRPSSRRAEDPGATTSHLGFRMAAGPG